MNHKKNPYMAYEKHKQEPSSPHMEEHMTEETAHTQNAENTSEKDNSMPEQEGSNMAQPQEQPRNEEDKDYPGIDAAALQAILNEERLRMLAEMDNFKKRMLREKEEQIRFAAEAVLSDLLPSLDNFELALSYGKSNEACREMVQGLEMTQKLLLDALAAHGLERVGKEGEEFNPEIHEALTRQSRDDMPPGHVAQLFQTGYRLKERLLRPAKVVVSS